MPLLRSRASAALVDQAAYSLQNFAVAFTALHQLELGALGAFALASTLVVFAQVGLRAGLLEPLTIRSSRADAARPVQQAAAMASGACLVAGAAVVIVTLSYALLGLSHGDLVAASGILLAIVMVQDSYRFGLFAARRLWSAALNDAATCVATLSALWVLGLQGLLDQVTILGAWAGGCFTGALLGAAQLRTWPRPDRAHVWWAEQRSLGLPLMGSVVAQQSMGRLSLVVVSVLGGAGQLGLIVAARTVLSPVNTVIASTYAFAVPDAVRRWEDSRHSLTRYTTALGSSLAGLAVMLCAVLLVLPLTWGRVIAGDNWDDARSLLVPTGLWIVGIALSQGARVGLRVLERTDLVFKVSLILGIWLLACTAFGVLLAGGEGAAWGFGVASLSGQLLWSTAYRRALSGAAPPDRLR